MIKLYPLNMRQLLETEQKALEINLDENIYGTFSEIGAGQEVARYFFQVGAAAGTIAKTMSAYDKVYSDQIYGREATGRYVCESRLYKMLDHEYQLMLNRLQNQRPNSNFFVFADTVSAINYQKTIKGNGWMGLRFQLKPDGEYNDLVLHVHMLDNDNQLQQQAIGILGVNLIYAVYHYSDEPEVMLQSLMDSLRGRVKIDLIRLTGPDFAHVDNRLLSLYLIKNKMTDVTMIGADGQTVHASEFLYKKNIMVVRGSFRPPTLVNMDMIRSGYQQFLNEAENDPERSFLLTEITLNNLQAEGEIDEKDFLDRVELLKELGQYVILSGSDDQQCLIKYLTNYKVQRLGLVVGIHVLLEMMTAKYYENKDGRLLAAFGELFTRNVKIYVYPALQEGSEELMTSKNMPLPDGVSLIVQHLLNSNQIVDVTAYNIDLLHIFSKEVLQMLREGDEEWEAMVPKKVATLVKEKYLFGYPYERMEFEY